MENLDTNQASSLSLTREELNKKIALEYIYLKHQIEEKLNDINDKNSKSIQKLLKNFESDLLKNLDQNITSNEQKMFIDLKSEKIDLELLKLKKFL